MSYVVSIILSILICFGLVSISPWDAESLDSRNPYYLAMVGNFLFTVFIAMWSALFNNSAFYDAWWSVGPMVFTVYWYAAAETNGKSIPTARVVLVFISVFTWGIRLTHNW